MERLTKQILKNSFTNLIFVKNPSQTIPRIIVLELNPSKFVRPSGKETLISENGLTYTMNRNIKYLYTLSFLIETSSLNKLLDVPKVFYDHKMITKSEIVISE